MATTRTWVMVDLPPLDVARPTKVRVMNLQSPAFMDDDTTCGELSTQSLLPLLDGSGAEWTHTFILEYQI